MGAEEMVHRAGADGMWKIGGYTGGPKSATGFLLGMLVHLIICFVWIAGVFVPLLCIVYFRSGWTLGLLLAISVYPMLMGYSPDGGWSRAGEWPAFRRALSRLGQLYYKECSYLIEDPDSMFETDEKVRKFSAFMCLRLRWLIVPFSGCYDTVGQEILTTGYDALLPPSWNTVLGLFDERRLSRGVRRRHGA